MQTIVSLSDGDLARAVAARPGSAEPAESELYRRFAPRVRLYGLRHLRDEDAARDLVQQVMLLTIEKLRSGSVRDVDRIHLRMYSLAPGETVPCAVFPGDDLVVAALRADFSGVDAVTLTVTGPGDSPSGEIGDVPVSGPGGEVLWATPAAVVRQMPSMRLQLTLASAGAARAELGTYVLDHSASTPPS